MEPRDKIKPEFREEFKKFVNGQDVSTEFMDYLDTDKDAMDAVDEAMDTVPMQWPNEKYSLNAIEREVFFAGLGGVGICLAVIILVVGYGYRDIIMALVGVAGIVANSIFIRSNVKSAVKYARDVGDTSFVQGYTCALKDNKYIEEMKKAEKDGSGTDTAVDG